MVASRYISDLEPVRGTICGRGVGNLRHVKGNRALVVNSLVGGEGDRGACGNGDGRGAAT